MVWMKPRKLEEVKRKWGGREEEEQKEEEEERRMCLFALSNYGSQGHGRLLRIPTRVLPRFLRSC